ncbi:non-ribosomal peptide synthetase [Streptomyces tropicalis]|uniref:Non-ribosomal peptide synthetase n=1 Tax=Streptomyces tropicalis TaxID=3034234 RepID=A0ABT6A866_9ACTN|nr:non-ribosomal peptide synthetase [Streptomyces tropicalis]MDF3300842.1 non-ribosomal peptide synthetase [Streptomyces tropicalis]
MVGEQCHALRLRLDGAVTDAELTARLAAAGPWRLWVEQVASGSDEPEALRRRDAELKRPTRAVRCVLLRHRDGVADLVVVADRSLLDRDGLDRLAGALVTGADPGLVGQGPAAVRRVAAPPAGPAPEWGGGARGATGWDTSCLDLPAVADPSALLAALALTLHRYEGHGAGGEVTVATDRRGALAHAVPADATLAELRAAVPAPADRPVTVGLIEPATGESGAVAGTEYLPCLAPPFPLTLTVLPGAAGGNRLWAAYRRSHLAPGTVDGFLRHLAHVLVRFGESPAMPADDVELLDAAERERVAALGRPGAAPAGTPERLTDVFARVAAARPDAPAVGNGHTALTYGELDRLADRLARGLVARGVAPGDRVGICLERTTELVAAVLGVLKAGAAYVPTDPAYPADRLAHTARDAGLELVITRHGEYPAEAGVPVTPDELLDGAGPLDALPGPQGPDDPAYVIYTSGSTGRPKGVVVPHRNVVALVDATRDEYGLGPADVWTFFHSGAFDFSVWEIWGCLLTGGRLVVVPYLVSREPGEFRDLLERERVTVLSQTPSSFSQLLETDHASLAVRLVVFGGEPLDARMLLRWFDLHPEAACRTVNMFGITETTVHVTAQTLTRELALAGSKSVGPALHGWHLYVTDTRGRLVPPGVTGEIRVGGAGVALGYLGRPDLTAARFTADPYAGGRQYRSGDLGRLRPDGALEHLGRIDSQVKIRGFRIELDEIRSVLLEDPDVRAAAVVVRRDDPSDPATARLDAYVVPADRDTAAVRKRAAAVLPAYMLPATVTALDSLPLTANGKLDAARLPEPARGASAPVAHPAGGGETAAVLQEVWSTVLGTPVGLDDDFFELGGNSLLAVRISAALRGRGLSPVPLRDLFRTPTIRELAEAGDA